LGRGKKREEPSERIRLDICVKVLEGKKGPGKGERRVSLVFSNLGGGE